MVDFAVEIIPTIFTWWRTYGRVLPWRQKIGVMSAPVAQHAAQTLREEAFASYFASNHLRNPYHVVLSEVMLQQTQVERVIVKYEEWLHRWPTLVDLAAAPLSEVLIAWQGMGYNRRARQLWLLAKQITDAEGKWPQTETSLLQLPGVGRYTARAVMVFAFGNQAGVVDTNIKRIFERVSGQHFLNEKQAFAFADTIFPQGQADPWHQALMDFGALICKAKAPRCGECPLARICQANFTAQRAGFTTFAEQLLQQRVARPPKTSGKDAGLRFEQTDRYFRGRIIDELRAGKLASKALRKILEVRYGLDDASRFERIVKNLIKEGMILLHEDEFSLSEN